jgi:hypothetical protein
MRNVSRLSKPTDLEVVLAVRGFEYGQVARRSNEPIQPDAASPRR